MKRLVVFALVGGGIGAGAALARNDAPSDGSAPQPDLKTAAMSGAAAGGFIGFVLDRRAKRKARKTKLVGYAHKARPKVEAALEAAFAAAEIALPKVEAAAEVARERAKERAVEAGGVAREKAVEAGAAARERAAEAAIHAKHVAAERADIAKRKAKKGGHPKAAKALDLLPV
ncbi:MAG: hypothetical protein QOI95_829 [Acidimicrobiaceae bacterium]|jgi:hypothetical protein